MIIQIFIIVRTGSLLDPGHSVKGPPQSGPVSGSSQFILRNHIFSSGSTLCRCFEISVVAGLITVLFALTVALTRKDSEVQEARLTKLVFPLFFVIFLIIDGLVMKGLLQQVPALPAGPETGTFGEVLWMARTFDLIASWV